jgi:hypothetical protein
MNEDTIRKGIKFFMGIDKRLKEEEYRQRMASKEMNPENKDITIKQFRLKQYLGKLTIEK